MYFQNDYCSTWVLSGYIAMKLLSDNKQMFAAYCQQVQQLLIIVTLLWTCLNTFSHFIFHTPLEVLCYNWSLLKDELVKTRAILNYATFMFNNSNKPIKIAQLQKLANQWRTCGGNGRKFLSWKQEKLLSFGKTRNVLIKNVKIWEVKNIFPLDFA